MTEEQLKSVIQEVVFDASSVEAVELELVKGHNICCKTIDGIKASYVLLYFAATIKGSYRLSEWLCLESNWK